MKMDVRIECRSVSDLEKEESLPKAKLRALMANPHLEKAGDLGKIVGMSDGREIGGEYVFPLFIKCGNARWKVLSGSTLYVDPQYRRSGLGMDLPELRWQKAPNGVALGAGLSQMAVPVHELLDYNVFPLPRLLMLWRSRPVVEMKLTGIAGRILSALVDIAVAGYATVLRGMVGLKMRGYRVRSVGPDDASALADVARLIAEDPHPYGEVHDEKWLKWHLSESFSEDGPAELHMIARDGKTVGFYMTKRRFHAQASHRGFRNVWLGSIIEWQAAKGYDSNLSWFLLNAALGLRKARVDAVELPTDDPRLLRFFRRLGWLRLGAGNFVIKAGTGSPLENDSSLGVQANWRLRPAMGDNGLS